MARLTLAESTVYAPVWYALFSRSTLAPSFEIEGRLAVR